LKHQTSPAFWRAYNGLSLAIRRQADKQFERLEDDPSHPSLQLKQAGRYWSARVNDSYRVIAVRSDQTLVWFWIGSHAEYDWLLK
jgi:hypothetical protein